MADYLAKTAEPNKDKLYDDVRGISKFGYKGLMKMESPPPVKWAQCSLVLWKMKIATLPKVFFRISFNRST